MRSTGLAADEYGRIGTVRDAANSFVRASIVGRGVCYATHHRLEKNGGAGDDTAILLSSGVYVFILHCNAPSRNLVRAFYSLC